MWSVRYKVYTAYVQSSTKYQQSDMKYNPNDPWERAAVGLLLGIIVLLLVTIVSVLF